MYTGWRFTRMGEVRDRIRGIGGSVVQVVRHGLRGLALVVFLAVSAVSFQTAPAQPSRSREQKRLTLAADKTFREGAQGKLPPHISSLLGISSRGEECPVMENAVRTGKVVQGFAVSLANKSDIVLFVVDEVVNDQSLYLTSRDGRLRKVVSVKAGEGRVSPITDHERKGFVKEKQFWLDRLAPVSASK